MSDLPHRQPLKLSHTHVAIMDYMLANPSISIAQIAAHFGYTQGWVSFLINSDIFRAAIAEKQDIIFHETVLPLHKKMENVAHLALDRLAQRIPLETEIGPLTKVADGVLSRLGFSSDRGGVNVNVNAPGGMVQVNTTRSEIEAARALIGKAPRPEIGVLIDAPALPAPNKTAVVKADPPPFTPFSADGSEEGAASERAET